MIYIPIFVNIVLLLLFDYRYLSFSLISDWNTFSNGCCLSAKQFYACALHKRMKPCREQRKTNSQFRTYFCTASFHSYNRSITFISHL